jgi:hypothetical protein
VVKPQPLKVDWPVFDVVESDESVDDSPDDLPTRLDNVLEHHLWWMKDDARMALIRDLMEQINKT